VNRSDEALNLYAQYRIEEPAAYYGARARSEYRNRRYRQLALAAILLASGACSILAIAFPSSIRIWQAAAAVCAGVGAAFVFATFLSSPASSADLYAGAAVNLRAAFELERIRQTDENAARDLAALIERVERIHSEVDTSLTSALRDGSGHGKV
jgi:hypothetical protein